jgi:hypothetical protein
VLRSITHWDPGEQRHVRLPFVSGNAIRGVLRRLVMRDLLTRLNWGEPPAKLYHALFAGGVLESGDDETGVIDLDFRRRVRSACPPIGALGCSVANQMIPSCLRVRHAFPVCAEYRSYLPDRLRADPRADHSVRTFTDVAFATRRDDLREERAADEQARQMKVDFETFVPGTLFAHGFTLVEPSELEAACLAHAVALWAEQPFIGGKAGSGYGQVRVTYEGLPDPTPYLDYLGSAGEAVREVLSELGGRLGA